MKFYEVKCVEPSYTLKKRKSQKKLARVHAYTHAYTQLHEGGGRSAPPGLNRVNFLYKKIPLFERDYLDPQTSVECYIM